MAKTEDLPTTPAALTKEAEKLRGELKQARLDHALQKLDSPAKLRALRARLARVLTMQHAQTKETSTK